MTGDREKMATEDWKEKVSRKKKLIEELKKKHGPLEFPRDLEDMMNDPVGEERNMAATRERARRRGVAEELIEQMYGKPRSKEEVLRALDEVRERARRYGWPEETIERHYGWTEEEIEQMFGEPRSTQAR
jgi:hypothetical protein